MSATWKPRLVKMPVPMMLAITIEDAVMKPTVRRGGGDFTEECSAIAVIVESTIPKLSGLANCFGVAFKFMISPASVGGFVRKRLSASRDFLLVSNERGVRSLDFPELSEAILGITLKAA